MQEFANSAAHFFFQGFQIDIKTIDVYALSFDESKMQYALASLSLRLKYIETCNRCSCFADISNIFFECFAINAYAQSMLLAQLVKRVRPFLT